MWPTWHGNGHGYRTWVVSHLQPMANAQRFTIQHSGTCACNDLRWISSHCIGPCCVVSRCFGTRYIKHRHTQQGTRRIRTRFISTRCIGTQRTVVGSRGNDTRCILNEKETTEQERMQAPLTAAITAARKAASRGAQSAPHLCAAHNACAGSRHGSPSRPTYPLACVAMNLVVVKCHCRQRDGAATRRRGRRRPER